MKQTTAELNHFLQQKLNQQTRQALLTHLFGRVACLHERGYWYIEVNDWLVLQANTPEAIQAAVQGLVYMVSFDGFAYHRQAWQRFVGQLPDVDESISSEIPDEVGFKLAQIVHLEKTLREQEAQFHIAPERVQDWLDGYLYKPYQRQALLDYAFYYEQRQAIKGYVVSTLRPHLSHLMNLMQTGRGGPLDCYHLFPLGLAVLWGEGLPISWLDGLYTDLTRPENTTITWEEYPGTVFVLMAEELIFVGSPAEFYAFIWGMALALTLKMGE